MTDSDRATLAKELLRDEGLKLKPYRDTVGKLSIGIGRNLDDVGISAEEAHVLLAHDITAVNAEMDRLFPWAAQMNGARQRVLANMLFNLGAGKLLKFKNTLAAMSAGQYQKASEGMLASLWARQVGDRAKRLAETMKTGQADV